MHPAAALRRFHARYVVAESGCWLWTWKTNNGYGRYGSGSAHRWAYIHLVGPIPEGLTIDHLCRNKICVNPAHMEPVTLLENIARATAFDTTGKGWRRDITHCRSGHPYDDANTYRYRDADGLHRRCQTCHRERQAAYKQRIRARAAA